MASPATRRERRWLPTLAVLGVILVVVFGGFVVAGALSEPAAGPPIRLDGAVSVQPLSGWQVATDRRSDDPAFVRITRGSGNLDVIAVIPYDGDAQALASEYVDKVLGGQLHQLSVSGDLTPVTVAGARDAGRFAYVGVNGDGTSVEGEVTVAITDRGDGVVFDGWAPEGLLSYVDGDIHTMIHRAVLG